MSLDICHNSKLTDVSILSISSHCRELKYLNIFKCWNLTDDSLIPLSESCKRLQWIFFGLDRVKRTQASITAIYKNCSELIRLSHVEDNQNVDDNDSYSDDSDSDDDDDDDDDE